LFGHALRYVKNKLLLRDKARYERQCSDTFPCLTLIVGKINDG